MIGQAAFEKAILNQRDRGLSRPKGTPTRPDSSAAPLTWPSGDRDRLPRIMCFRAAVFSQVCGRGIKNLRSSRKQGFWASAEGAEDLTRNCSRGILSNPSEVFDGRIDAVCQFATGIASS